jgi:hypothetical protein
VELVGVEDFAVQPAAAIRNRQIRKHRT